MTKQEVLEIYGQSVYQIRLSVAMHSFIAKGETCLEEADKFVRALQSEDKLELIEKFK